MFTFLIFTRLSVEMVIKHFYGATRLYKINRERESPDDVTLFLGGGFILKWGVEVYFSWSVSSSALYFNFHCMYCFKIYSPSVTLSIVLTTVTPTAHPQLMK